MLQPRAVQLARAKQGAERAARVGFHFEQGPTVRARGTRVEKRVNLVLTQVSLEGTEELCGLGEGHPEMFDALVIFVAQFLAWIIHESQTRPWDSLHSVL